MTVTRTEFLTRFPEFNNTDVDVALVDLILIEAHEVVSLTVFGTKRDQAIKYFAASLLTDAAFGEPSRLSDDDRKTRYEKRYDQIKFMVTAGCRNT